ncbi:Lrp/AsnC family transcriptional regulator [Candidatus Woesearchaeota archaeon]|nr:Lrp/AsnC family transcriptional regulator [Candidatus Woesearchaeota archaeon]
MSKKYFKGQIENINPTVKLDLIDRKILYLLGQNARISTNAIAKKIKISRDIVSYRIKKLSEQKVISGFITYINLRSLGYTIFTVFLRLKNLEREKEIITYLDHSSNVVLVQNCGGYYNLQFEVATIEIEHFDSFFSEFISKFDNLVVSYDILLQVTTQYTGRGAIVGNKELQAQLDNIKDAKGSSFMKEFNLKQSKKEVDLVDKKILKALSLNSRMPILGVAKKTKLAPNTVINRLRTLIKSKVIKQFLVVLNFNLMGYQWHSLLLKLKNVDQEKLFTFCKNHPNIAFIASYIGMWNYKISIFTQNNYEFHDVVQEFQDLFSDHILEYGSMIMYSRIKYDQKLG